MNQLNHGYTLSGLVTEIKFSADDRSHSRYGRNGEVTASQHHRSLCRRYNKATRKASKNQLKKYAG